MALVAGKAPTVEGNICGFHRRHVALCFMVGFVVGFAGRFAVARFRHVCFFVGGYELLYEDSDACTECSDSEEGSNTNSYIHSFQWA